MPSTIRKISIRLLKITGGILLLLALYGIAAFTVPYIAVNTQPRTPPDSEAITIYIKSNGVHADIITPVRTAQQNWYDMLDWRDTDSQDSTYAYAGFGWGDKGFYLQTPEWKDLKFSVAFKAMAYLSSAAMHISYYKTVHESDKCYKIKISLEDYRILCDYIKKSFRYDSNNKVILIPSSNDGYGNNDAFYEAERRYSLFYTCNTWANNALKACNQKACLWTVTDKGILYHYKH